MDAFYAAVEQRDFPELRGKPVVVGGPPNSRGVVCTASYEARTFGVRSAMPCSQAFRLCPEAIFVAPRFEAYKEVSAHLHGLFREFTDQIEPLSLDEAYLDVTENKRGWEHATPIAQELRERIRGELSLTGSAGVSYCKFLAKIASDARKPDGLTIVRPSQARALIDALPVGRFHGVGPVTERRLHEHTLRTGSDIHRFGETNMGRVLGRMGAFLWRLSDGQDDRPVEAERERKSVGAEDTFEKDEADVLVLRRFLRDLAGKVAERLARAGLQGRTVTVKVKFSDFRQVTRSRTLDEAVDARETLERLAMDLLSDTDAGARPVRLLGIQVSQFGADANTPDGVWEQLELPFESDSGSLATGEIHPGSPHPETPGEHLGF